MNDVVKPFDREEWYRRLRSGAIKQGQFSLGFTDGARCCLGVMCDMAVEAGVIPAPIVEYDGSTRLLYDGCRLSVPGAVKKWAQLHDPYGGSLNDRLPGLTNLNDLDEYSLSRIADHVQANEDAYFASSAR